MADEQKTPAPSPSPQQAGKPAQPATAKVTEAQPAESGTFSDGSTQAQRDAQIKAAEETNAATKKLADAEREARGQ
jgi:hypothetical protein